MKRPLSNFWKLLKKMIFPTLGLIVVVILIYRFLFDLQSFSRSLASISLPAALLCAFLLFRRQIAERISSITELSAGGMTTKLNLSQGQIETEIASKQLAEATKDGAHENFSKDEVIEIMNISAAWGFDMSKIGFKSTPIPQVTWEGRNPVINFGIGDSKSYDELEKTLIIQKIYETQDSLDSLTFLDQMSTGLTPSKETVLKKKLKRLKDQLREIDPGSSFLN